MQRWMCGVTTRDKIRNEHIRGTDNKIGAIVQENYRKRLKIWTYQGKEEEDGQTYDGKMHARET